MKGPGALPVIRVDEVCKFLGGWGVTKFTDYCSLLTYEQFVWYVIVSELRRYVVAERNYENFYLC